MNAYRISADYNSNVRVLQAYCYLSFTICVRRCYDIRINPGVTSERWNVVLHGMADKFHLSQDVSGTRTPNSS